MAEDQPNNVPAIYETESGAIEIRMDAANETCWVTQQGIAEMFGTTKQNASLHLKNIFQEGELDAEATVKKILTVQTEGGREVNRSIEHYSLDAVLAVGYRVSSAKATVFRKWATSQLRSVIENGFAINEGRLEQDPEALARLADVVRKHRLSERNVYEKMRDIFKDGSVDYDPKADETRKFYAHVQDMLHYAITGQTSSQLLRDRCSSKKPDCGVLVKAGEHPTMDEARIAKNYLDPLELRRLENVAEMWMNYVESRALMDQKLTMSQMLFQVQTLLKFLDLPIMFEYPKGWNRAMAEAHVAKEMGVLKTKLGIASVKQALPNKKSKGAG